MLSNVLCQVLSQSREKTTSGERYPSATTQLSKQWYPISVKIESYKYFPFYEVLVIILLMIIR